MRFSLLALLLFTDVFVGIAQQSSVNQLGQKYHINWQAPVSSSVSQNEVIQLLNFSTAHYSFADEFLPRHYQSIEIDGSETTISVKLVNDVYQPLSDAEVALLKSTSRIL